MTHQVPITVGEVYTGQKLRLQAHSEILKGSYFTEVLSFQEEKGRLQVATPFVDGRVVLIPVGSVLAVFSAEDMFLGDYEVKERTSGDQRSLVLMPVVGPDEELWLVSERKMEIWPVSSGKGGVGKTTFVINLALVLSSLGKRVCILDGDLGTANVDVVLDLSPRFNLTHVLSGHYGLMDVLIEGPQGISVLPGGSGLQELTELSNSEYNRLLREFSTIEDYIDILIVDTSSGLAKGVTNFVVAAQRGIIVTTPEPHAITDAYALIKVLAKADPDVRLRLVVNRAENEKEAKDVADKIIFAADKFLGMNVEYFGFIYDDDLVKRAVKRQKAVVLTHPRSRASSSFYRLGQRLLATEGCERKEHSAVQSLFQRMRSIFGTN